MTNGELLHLFTALATLLVTVHLVGALSVRLRQPRVAGELVGGLLLGPTVLGAVAPRLQETLFPGSGPVGDTLSAVQGIGLLMLMFFAGAEVRRLLPRDDRRVVTWIVLAGLLIPFAVGLLVVRLLGAGALLGPADSVPALTLVTASAIAVTSIPVISRIMIDLGIIHTSFAAIVLSTAVAEDVVLYVVIAVALGLAQVPGHAATGLPDLLGVTSTGWLSAYYVLTTLTLFAVVLAVAPTVGRRFARRLLPKVGTPIGSTITCVLLTLGCGAGAAVLGVQPMFGAFLAGVLLAHVDTESGVSLTDGCRSFSFAFFLPVYFGAVGLGLDLSRNLLLGFTCALLAIACLVKVSSVYLGARLGGERGGPALNLAIALNARGGPGIALAGLALSSGIVNEQLYTSMIMLAVCTSLMAGAWLRMVVDRGHPLRRAAEPHEPTARRPTWLRVGRVVRLPGIRRARQRGEAA
ncbi:MAG TPA: cation:proton antiporter [Actinophytocola sp.]|uniref:cation:proton antiporter n=1 Tax=Actinophytocola sp. TaxID=1872138 RepID=UPI002DDCEF48|nr:cation:proton antiporter [Actinophytocola sp.]HEV2778238.1 cation:proton antiporter [Actinophytocola sp.]